MVGSMIVAMPARRSLRPSASSVPKTFITVLPTETKMDPSGCSRTRTPICAPATESRSLSGPVRATSNLYFRPSKVISMGKRLMPPTSRSRPSWLLERSSITAASLARIVSMARKTAA